MKVFNSEHTKKNKKPTLAGNLDIAYAKDKWKVEMVKTVFDEKKLKIASAVNRVLKRYEEYDLKLKDINYYSDYYIIRVIKKVNINGGEIKLNTIFKVSYKYVAPNKIEIYCVEIKEV